MLPVVQELAQRRAVIAFLPADGPLENALREAGAEIRPGFELSAALRRTSRHYGISSLPRVVGEAGLQQTRLVRALRGEAFAAAYCNGYRAQLGATVPSLIARIPLIWHVRDFIPTGFIGSVWSFLSRRAALVVANSAATATQPTLNGMRRQPIVIPNGIDLEIFRAREGEPPGPPLVGMAAHLTEWKGHSRFLRILRAVRETMPDARGAIAGGAIYDTADQRRNLERVTAEVTRLGLSDACAIEAIAPTEMPGWLGKLTVLVHCPDRPEPFGRALAEAMAVGVPIVAAAGEGAAEVLGPSAVIAPLGDENAVVRGVVQVLNDPHRRSALTAAGQARARDQYDVHVYATRVAEAILEVAERADAEASRS